MTSVYKGTTAECLSHLGKHIQEGRKKKVEILATFCDAKYRTVERWIDGKNPPIGEKLLRLRFYLEFIGYSVTEITELKPIIRDAARLCAFRVVTILEIAHMVGYTERKIRDSHRDTAADAILCVFRGVQGVYKDKIPQFETLVKMYEDMLPQKMESTPRIELSTQHKPRVEQVPAQEVPRVRPFRPKLGLKRPLDTHNGIIESVASIIKGIIPLVNLLESDEFTPEERAQFRERVGGNGVFEFSNSFFRLCGERTRTEHQLKESSR